MSQSARAGGAPWRPRPLLSQPSPAPAAPPSSITVAVSQAGRHSVTASIRHVRFPCVSQIVLMHSGFGPQTPPQCTHSCAAPAQPQEGVAAGVPAPVGGGQLRYLRITDALDAWVVRAQPRRGVARQGEGCGGRRRRHRCRLLLCMPGRAVCPGCSCCRRLRLLRHRQPPHSAWRCCCCRCRCAVQCSSGSQGGGM